MTDVFKKHGKRIAREDANIPKPILDVLYGSTPARFPNVSCSSCGEAFGPGDSGFSHCSDHKGLVPTGD
jgi:hypothetical protein